MKKPIERLTKWGRVGRVALLWCNPAVVLVAGVVQLASHYAKKPTYKQ